MNHRASEGPGPAHPAPEIPGHRIIAWIAGGGYGDVWLAENTFGTRRAVKVVYRDRFDGPAPYLRELEGVRQFEPLSRGHEGLVDVLQVGHNEAGGWFHYVMELADDEGAATAGGLPATPRAETADVAVPAPSDAGQIAGRPTSAEVGSGYTPRTLRSELRARGRLPVPECARIGLRLAEALEYLHTHDCVHRDLNPANVVFVDGVPKLADVGLVARTGSHSMVGTDGYIPPEGPGKPPADIYSLGKVLYELATGKDRRAFPEPLTRQDEEPEHAALADLNQIVVKACDPNPAHRYANASALKQDLLLLLAGKSVREIHRLRHRVARLRRVGAAALISALVVGGALWLQVRQTRQVRALAEVNRQQLVRLNVTAGVRAMDDGDPMGALPWFVEALRLDAGIPAAEEPHRYRIEGVRRQCPKLVQLGLHTGPINHAQLSPDDTRLVTASDDGTAFVWDLATGEKLTPPLRHGESVLWATFSPDGRAVATGGGDGVARIWDAATGEPLTPPLVHGSNVVEVAFSPDGRLLATAAWDNTARLFDVRTSQIVGEPMVHSNRVKCVAFSPDGGLLAAAGESGEVSLWHTGSGQRARPSLPHPDDVRRLRFTPDGQLLLTACGDGVARLWRVDSGELAAPPMRSGDGGPIWWIAFSPDGRRLATAGGQFGTSGEVRVWDAATGLPISPALRFIMPVRGAAFSPDGRWLATGCLDATARLWESESSKPVAVPLRHQLAVWTVAFTADGQRLLTSGRDGSWRLWDLATEESLAPFLPHELAWRVAFSPDGRYLATGGLEGPAKVWDVTTKRLLATLAPAPPPDVAVEVVFSPDGRWLATGTMNGVAAVYEVPSGRLCWPPIRHAARVFAVAFSSDGQTLATASDDGTARLWSVGTGQPVTAPFRHRYGVHAICFSPDGRLVATGAGQHATRHAKGEVRLWSRVTGDLVAGPLECDGDAWALAFSPDGRILIAGTDDLTPKGHTIGAWETATGQPLGWSVRHNDGFESVAFSRDGRFLATGGQDAIGRVWTTEGRVSEVLTVRHKTSIRRIAFSSDGKWLLTSSSDGTARVWDARTGEPLGPPLRHQDNVMDSVWSPDGQQVATASGDGTARIWELGRNDWPLWDLTQFAEVMSGGRLDAAGRIEPLAPEKWRERWLDLKSRRPAAFASSTEQAVAWHLRQVEAAERGGLVPAGRFHREQVSKLKPGDAGFPSRLQDSRP